MKKRERNYEILRIVAMLMIVCLHYLSKGGALEYPTRSLTPTGYVSWFIEAFCLVAVNVYILLSGYFGIGKKQTDLKDVFLRIIRIWLQVMFYSVGIGVLFLMLGKQKFDIYTLLTYVFPIVTEHYWFATAYLLLTLFSPFLNSGVNSINKRSLQGILLCMLLVFSVAKTVLPMQLPWDKKGYDAFWFVFLYLTGAYLRKYGVKWIKSRTRAVILYVVCSLMIFSSLLIIRALYLKYGILENFITYGYSYNFLLCYLGAIGLFLSFQSNAKTGEPKICSKILQTVSGATFGVYLIHEHINLRYLWQTWFHCADFIHAPVFVFVLHMLATITIVFIGCIGIEILRKAIMDRLLDKCFIQNERKKENDTTEEI